MQLRLYELLKTLVNMVLSLITFFLIMRVVLKFFSTNPQTPFVAWIYAISDYLIRPFAGIVPNINTNTGILDIVTLISLLAYLVLGYIILSIIQGMTVAAIDESEYPATTHYHEVRGRRKHKYPQDEDYDL